MDGRLRVLRGSDEAQTAQLQPSVGTPIEVPLPRMTISAFMRRELFLFLRRTRRLLGNGVGDFEEHHAGLKESVLQQALFFFGEIAFGLFLKNPEHVDALARAEDVDMGFLSGLCSCAESDNGREVDGLDDVLEGDGRDGAGRRVGGAEHGVNMIRRLLIGVLCSGFVLCVDFRRCGFFFCCWFRTCFGRGLYNSGRFFLRRRGYEARSRRRFRSLLRLGRFFLGCGFGNSFITQIAFEREFATVGDGE